MDVSRRTWPTAHEEACDAKKARTPLRLWYRDRELELTVTSIREYKMGDQILLKGTDIDVVMATTTGSDQVELSFYPRG